MKSRTTGSVRGRGPWCEVPLDPSLDRTTVFICREASDFLDFVILNEGFNHRFTNNLSVNVVLYVLIYEEI